MSYEDIATLGFKAETSDLEKAANALDKMSVAAGKTDSAVKKAESSMQSTSSASARLDRDITSLVSAAQAAAAAFAAWRITKLGEDALLAAARFQTLGVVMEVAGRNAGYTAEQMHTFERALNANGIAMKESRETLTRLAAAHVNLADSAKLARAAQDLAVAGDINSSEAFARMVQGIQKAETEIMRSIGLNIQWEQGYQKFANSVGVATSALSEQQKTQARVNQTLEAAAAYAQLYESAMETAGKQLTSMPRYLQNISILAGSIGLPAFSSSILAATEGLKSLEAMLESLTNDGTIAKWGVELDSSLKTVVSGVDNVLVAFALYKAAQAGIALATSVSSGAIGLQIALFRMEAQTASAAAVATRGLGAALMSLAANPVFALVALGSVLYALWEHMQSGNKEIDDLKNHFTEMTAGINSATDATTKFKDAQEALKIALAQREVDEAAQRVEKYGEQLKTMSESFKAEMPAASGPLEAVSNGLEQDYFTEIPKEVLEAISDYNSGMRDAENLLVRLLELKKQGVSVDDAATTKLMDLIQAYLASNDLLDKKNQKLKAVTDSTKGLSEAEAEAKRTNDAWKETLEAINKGLNKYNEAMKLPSSVEEATVFLLKYTGQSKLAEQAMKDLARTQANAAIETLQHAAALALFNGDAAKTVEILAVIDNFKTYLNADGSIISPKSGAGSASAIDKVTEATLKLNEELAKVKGTNAIAAYDDIAKKIHDLEKDLGKANPKVAELNDLLTKKAGEDLLLDIMKHTEPAAAGVKEVSREYEQLIKNIEFAASKGLLSEDDAAVQKQKAEAWRRASEIEKQNNLLTQQIDIVQKIQSLGGQSALAVDLQIKQLDTISEKLKLQYPELADLVDEWQRLAKVDLKSPEASLKRQIEYLRHQRDAWSGVQAAVANYALEAENYEASIEKLTTKTLGTIEDKFTQTFSSSFKTGVSLFDEMLTEMIRIALVRPVIVQMAGVMTGIIGYFMPSGSGQSGGGSEGSGGSSGVYGMASGMAQQYATNKLMSEATSTFGDTVNGWAASAFPNTFAPNAAAAAYNAPLTGGEALLWEGVAGEAPKALGPTDTFTGSISSSFNPWNVGAGFAGSALANYVIAPALHMDTKSTGSQVGSAVGGFGGALAGAKIGAMAGSWGGPIGAGVGALVGTLAGLLAGGALSGGSGSEPGLWVLGNIDLDASDSSSHMESISRPNKGRSGFADATSQGYYIQARSRNGMDASAASGAAKYLSQLADQVINLSASVKTSLGDIDSSLGSQYSDYLAAQKWIQVTGNGEGDDTPNVEELGKNLINQAYGRITDAVAHMDLSKVAIAADGMAADTMAEMSKAITKAAGIANISQSMGDYADEYLAAIGKPLLDALNAIDTSKLALEVDKSSLAGWAQAAVAIQAMDNVKTSIDGIVTPASEMTVAMSAANTQLDTWIASLKQLGWQEEAIAEVEAKRSAYLEQYWNAMARGAEQNLYLRSVALSSGTDSLEYQLQALKYQQENERNEYAKKYGSEDELLAAKAAQLNKEAYKDKTDWDNAAVYQAITDAGMTVAEWLERFGRSEGFMSQNISLSNQLMYTQQAESIQMELNYWQKQYDSMMKAQIAAEQEKASSDYAAFRDKISDEQNKLQEQYRAEQELMQEQISSTRDAIGSLEDLVDSFEKASEKLDDARHDLWGGTNNLSTSRMSDVRANWSEVYAKAMAGDTDAMSELPSISTNLLNLGKEQLESRDVYQDLFYDVDRKLKDAQGVAKSQYSVNKSQYDAQKSLLASQEAALAAQKVQYDEQNAKLNAQLSAQQAAYNTQIAQLNAQSAQLNTQSAQLNAQNTSNYTLSDISSKISSLTAQLAKSTTQAASTPTTQNEALLQSKANQLNMIGYMGRTNWNSQSVQNEIHAAGMSLDQWWTNFGFGEGISSTYKSTTSTKYNSDAALLAAKAAKMNEGKTLAPGQTAGGWTAAKVAQYITSSGMTISSWYDNFGKAEGFAKGGITPANKPFLVGENGPELVVSPQQWGVINNTDSMALMRGMSGGGNIDSDSIVAAINNMNDTLRQLLTKTDRIMADQGRIRDRMDMFAQEGVTIAAA